MYGKEFMVPVCSGFLCKESALLFADKCGALVKTNARLSALC